MSLKTQARILRILQEQKFERVGGTRTLMVDVRVIAASNKDLEREIERGTFREDLYYRLNVIPIQVPPLRERKEDISLLVRTFLKESSEEGHIVAKTITPQALEHLMAYPWPGNVRELKNLVERLAIMTEADVIDEGDIPPPYKRKDSRVAEPGLLSTVSLKEAKREFEKAYILRKLSENQNNISQTADAIGLERSHLHKKIKSYGLTL
jgi:two-component system nitrogen regulation response regulator NtrX